MVTNASAAIVTYNTPISVPATFAGIYVNFVTGAFGTVPTAGWDFNPDSSGTSLSFFWSATTTPPSQAAGVGARPMSTLHRGT